MFVSPQLAGASKWRCGSACLLFFQGHESHCQHACSAAIPARVPHEQQPGSFILLFSGTSRRVSAQLTFSPLLVLPPEPLSPAALPLHYPSRGLVAPQSPPLHAQSPTQGRDPFPETVSSVRTGLEVGSQEAGGRHQWPGLRAPRSRRGPASCQTLQPKRLVELWAAR